MRTKRLTDLGVKGVAAERCIPVPPSRALRSCCKLRPTKHGSIDDWREAQRNLVVTKAQVINEIDDAVLFKAYCSSHPSSSLYQWNTYKVSRSDLSPGDRKTIRGLAGAD